LRRQIDQRVGQRATLSHENLRANQIDAGDFFGACMLHLNPRIHFDEVKLVRVGVDQKLHGAGAAIVHRVSDGQRGIADLFPQLRVEVDRRGDLDDFLMPTLQRTIPLEQMHEPTVLVAHQLHFDMPRALNKFFEEHVAGAEGIQTFALCRFQCIR